MRRIFHLVLCFSLMLLPLPVFGAGKYDAASSSSKKKKKKKKKRVKKVKPAEEEQALEAERAQGDDDDEESQGSRRKKKRRGKVIEVDAEGEGREVTAEGDPPKNDKPVKTDAPTKAAAPAAVATAEEEEEEDDDVSFEDNPSKMFEALNKAVPPRRYAYVVGAVVGGVGLVFAFQAQGEAKRAETIVSALEAQRAVSTARASAALANVMYGLAAAAVLLALVLEFIPEPIAEKAAMVFRF